MADYIERAAVVKYLLSRKEDFLDDYGKGWSVGIGAASGICGSFYTPDDDGLEQVWKGAVWCNPPYRREIGKWVKKAAESNTTVVRHERPPIRQTSVEPSYRIRSSQRLCA